VWHRLQGAAAQRLGVMAQQVRAVLERHGALGTNIVREDAQVGCWGGSGRLLMNRKTPGERG
jgi:hypothetical protein